MSSAKENLISGLEQGKYQLDSYRRQLEDIVNLHRLQEAEQNDKMYGIQEKADKVCVEAGKRVCQAMEELEHVKKQREEAMSNVAIKHAQIEALNERIREWEAEKVLWQSREQEAKDEAAVLAKEVRSEKSKLKGLEGEVDKLRRGVELERERGEAERERGVAAFEKQLEGEGWKHRYNDLMSQLETERASWDIEAARMQAIVDEVTAEDREAFRARLKGEFEARLETALAHSKRANELEKQSIQEKSKVEYELKMEDVKNEMVRYRTLYHECVTEKTSLVERYERLKDSLDDVAAVNVGLNAQIADLTDELELLRTVPHKGLAQKDGIIDTLEEELNAKNMEIQSMQERNFALKEETMRFKSLLSKELSHFERTVETNRVLKRKRFTSLASLAKNDDAVPVYSMEISSQDGRFVLTNSGCDSVPLEGWTLSIGTHIMNLPPSVLYPSQSMNVWVSNEFADDTRSTEFDCYWKMDMGPSLADKSLQLVTPRGDILSSFPLSNHANVDSYIVKLLILTLP